MGFSQTGWECGHKIKDVPLNECVVCLLAEKDKEIERLKKTPSAIDIDIFKAWADEQLAKAKGGGNE